MNNIVFLVNNYLDYLKVNPLIDMLIDYFDITLIQLGENVNDKLKEILFNNFKFHRPDTQITFEKKTNICEFYDKYINDDGYLKDKNLVIQDLINGRVDLGEILTKLKTSLRKIRPDLVMIFGYDSNALLAAICLKEMNINFSYTESGLDNITNKLEETNRILIESLAKYHFVTHQHAIENLKKNGITENVYLVGSLIDKNKLTFIDNILNNLVTNCIELNPNIDIDIESASYKIYERLQIERHLKHRMGIYYNNSCKINITNDDLVQLQKQSKYVSFIRRINKNTEYNENNILHLKNHKDIYDTIVKYADTNVDFILRMLDGSRIISMTHSNHINECGPIFSFNRHKGLNIILYPLLTGYQDYGGWSFKLFDNIIWENKINKLICRVSMRGIFEINKKFLYFNSCVKEYNRLVEKNEYNCAHEALLLSFDRFKFVVKYINSTNIDCGLVVRDSEEIIKGYEYLFKDILKQNEMNKYKYHIYIEGNDLGSNLPWIFLNKGCLLMPKDLLFDSIFTVNLKPWVHYAPIKNDFSDVDEILSYLIKNDHIGEKIANNGYKYIKQFTNEDLMNKIKIETIERYCKNYRIE